MLEDGRVREFDDEPAFGVAVRWKGARGPDHDRFGPYDRLEDELSRILRSAASKFAMYADALRIVVIEMFGEIQILGPDWLTEAVQGLGMPDEIDELWLSDTFVSDSGLLWEFDRVG